MKIVSRLLALLVLGFLPAAAGLAQAAGANPATVASPRNEAWLGRHNGFVALAKQGNIDLLFVGDSITDYWRDKGREVWAQRYEPLHAANFGIAADRTEHLLWRLQNGELDGLHPKVTVLLIGINNSGRDTAAGIAEGIAANVQEIRKRCPDTKVLLLGVFPCGPRGDLAIRAKVKAINQLAARLEDGQHVFFLDIGERFLQPDGALPATIMPDSLHPSAEGYRIWADAMANKLAALLK